MRWRVRTMALLAAVLGACGHALADFPGYPPAAPASVEHTDATQPPRTVASPAAGTAAPLRLPARFQVPQRGSETQNELVSDSSPSAERLVDRGQAIPLAAPSAAAKGGDGGNGASAWLSGAASLGLVLGLFLLVVWAVRRGMPKNAAVLPREALEILGRAPLVGRQQVHLVRCGNKILLLCVSTTSVETLTEITDPAEVDRLAAICQRTPTNGFRQVLAPFGRPRQSEYLSDHEAEELDYRHLDELVHERHGGARA
jgi:flagellar biogenesis protein FliO